MVELVLPNDANPLGTILGGKVMHLIDIAAAIAAQRHCRRPVVTASIDRVDFLHPIRVGQLIILKASVNHAAHTSMEVGVRVESEDPQTGDRLHTASAYATFVALGPSGRPTQVPPLRLRTEEDRRRFDEASVRRETRLRDREARAARLRAAQGTETRSHAPGGGVTEGGRN
jgi:acyl-CoA hydrolase